MNGVVVRILVEKRKGGWNDGGRRERESERMCEKHASPLAVNWTEIYCQCGISFNPSVGGRH